MFARFVIFAVVVALPTMALSQNRSQQRLVQPPTATEAFQLRTICGQLAQKLAQKYRERLNIPGHTIDAVSHYGFRRATCYVLITDQIYQPVKEGAWTRFNNTLVEAQADLELAFSSSNIGPNGQRNKWGNVEDPSYPNIEKPKGFSDQEWDAWGTAQFERAEKYISEKMAED